jgi:hypothetical protein
MPKWPAQASADGRSLRSKWIDRLSPALSVSLLADLIGVIADYAAPHPLRWSATRHAPAVKLTGPLDEDGCSRQLSFRTGDNPLNVALSDCSIGSLPISRTASALKGRCVQWTIICRLPHWTWHILGVGRAETALQPVCDAYGSDALARGLHFSTDATVLEIALVHPDARFRHVTVQAPFPSEPDAIHLQCTADLQADTLSFAWKGFDLQR